MQTVYHRAARYRAWRLRRGGDLTEQVVQGPGRAAGELLDGAGHLGGVAAGARAAVVLVQADERVGEPVAKTGAEQALAGRVVGHVGVADAAAGRRAQPGGDVGVGQRLRAGDVVVRAGVPRFGEGDGGHRGDVPGVDHAEPGLSRVDVEGPRRVDS